MSDKYIFCGGMFRSGTTLLAKILNAHTDISLSSDPFLNFFKALRSDIASSIGMDRPYSRPIDDYYFSEEGLTLLQAVHNIDLAEIEPSWDRQDLWDYVRRHGTPYSPLIMEQLDSVEGRSYRELLANLLALTRTPGVSFGGIKEVWINEFIPALARTFPEMKFIEIVRDPRAVCASKNTREEKYPWLFLCRQWRKLAALALAHKQDPDLEDRVLVIRYEDLAAQPQQAACAIAAFLGLDYCSEMLDPKNYVDGEGRQWQQNSSYTSETSAVNASSLERWRTVLSPREVAFIDWICGPEMSLFEYPISDPEPPHDLAIRPPVIAQAGIAKWIAKVYPSTIADTVMELAKERIRSDFLGAPAGDLEQIDPQVIRCSFLSEPLFRRMREAEALSKSA